MPPSSVGNLPTTHAWSKPWVISSKGNAFEWTPDGGTWTPRGTGALDIAIGTDGSVFAVGSDKKLYRWQKDGWTEIGGRAERVAVDAGGIPWVVDPEGRIVRVERQGESWIGKPLPGLAKDIAIGQEGSV